MRLKSFYSKSLELSVFHVSPVGRGWWKWEHVAFPHWLPPHEVWGQPGRAGWLFWCCALRKGSPEPWPAPVHTPRPRRHLHPDQRGPKDTRVQHRAVARVRVRLNNFCRSTAYIVTGVTTRGNMIRRNNQDRVAVPEDVWSAYCCTEYDRNSPHPMRVLFPSHAALAKNAKETQSVHEMTVQELESFLKNNMDVDQNFQLFYDNCISPSPLPLYLQHTIWWLLHLICQHWVYTYYDTYMCLNEV